MADSADVREGGREGGSECERERYKEKVKERERESDSQPAVCHALYDHATALGLISSESHPSRAHPSLFRVGLGLIRVGLSQRNVRDFGRSPRAAADAGALPRGVLRSGGALAAVDSLRFGLKKKTESGFLRPWVEPFEADPV